MTSLQPIGGVVAANTRITRFWDVRAGGTVTSVGYLEEIESRRGSKGGYSSGTLASMLATPIVFRSAKGDNGLLPAKRFIAIVSESHPHPSYSSFHGTFLVAVRSDESILKFSDRAAPRQFATS
jgi:hypothetical protein